MYSAFTLPQAESDRRVEVGVRRGGTVSYVGSTDVVVGDIVTLGGFSARL